MSISWRMLRAFSDEDVSVGEVDIASPGSDLDLDLFTEDSVLEYGYCTEVLLRLQRAKTNLDTFDPSLILEYLKTIGNSVVTFRKGSIVKIHVHTKTPDKVLSFCQRYGEFLKIKIENMSLQHNNTTLPGTPAPADVERKKYGIVAVASGEGIKEMFSDRGPTE